MTEAELLRIVGLSYSVTGCELTGGMDALIKSRRATIRETVRITVTGVPVAPPAADRSV